MRICRSTLQQYFLSVKRSGKQHKISYQLLSTSWGGWDEGFVEYKLTCHWKQWRALARRLRQVKMLEILVQSSIRWLAQALLHLELRADEQTHLKSRIFDQRSARRQEQRYVEYFGLPERVCEKKSQNLPRKEQQKRLETTRSSTAVACFAPFEKRSVIIWDSIIIWEWAFEGILRPICREKGHSCGMAGWRIAANLAKFQLGPSHSFSLEQNLSFLLCFRCNLENHSLWSGLGKIYAKWDFNGNENYTTCVWNSTDNDFFV